ncbi:MAG: 16S rRNA (cytosine(1402)-N(4))-methyltransferase RsmH [Candidatus Buchananbacteria bacterium]
MYEHQSVLLAEVLEFLNPQLGQKFIDCTLGGAGHTKEIAKKVGELGQVLALDLDDEAIKSSYKFLQTEKLSQQVIIVKENFKNLGAIVRQLKPGESFDGILLDLGISTPQLKQPEQGFGFKAERLDMRMDKTTALTAAEIVNTYSVAELVKIFKNYGDEKLARPIALAIVAAREKQAVSSPQMLVEVISQVYAKHYRRASKLNPATKVFMALRIAVNDELNNLQLVLPQALELLKVGGRLAVITFHSLEDRLVKNFFRQESKNCLCPPALPICQCQHRASLQILTKKPVKATTEELARNPSARSAQLRVAQKIK